MRHLDMAVGCSPTAPELKMCIFSDCDHCFEHSLYAMPKQPRVPKSILPLLRGC